MHFAVLCSPDSWYFRDLRRGAERSRGFDHYVSRSHGWQVGPEARIASAKFDLRTVDAVLVRTMPPGSLEQVVFRMDVLARLEAAGTLVVNPPRAIEAAVDKYLTTAKLHAAGLSTPRTFICQTVDDALAGFDALGGDVVLKPLFGAEGRGITRLNDEALRNGPSACSSDSARCFTCKSSFRMMDSTCGCWSSARGCGGCGGAIRSIGAPTSVAARRPNRWSLPPSWSNLPARGRGSWRAGGWSGFVAGHGRRAVCARSQRGAGLAGPFARVRCRCGSRGVRIHGSRSPAAKVIKPRPSSSIQPRPLVAEMSFPATSFSMPPSPADLESAAHGHRHAGAAEITINFNVRQATHGHCPADAGGHRGRGAGQA